MNRSDFFIVMVNAGLLYVAMSRYLFYKKRYNSSNFLKRFNIINIRVLNCMK
jgi:hypothetical protein